jgi:hypothetical protein
MASAAAKVGKNPAYLPAEQLDFTRCKYEEYLDAYVYRIGELAQQNVRVQEAVEDHELRFLSQQLEKLYHALNDPADEEPGDPTQVWAGGDAHGPTVALDFDGVLAEYDGWRGVDHMGKPLPGAREFVQRLKDAGFCVIVHSCRAPHYLKQWADKGNNILDAQKKSSRIIPREFLRCQDLPLAPSVRMC